MSVTGLDRQPAAHLCRRDPQDLLVVSRIDNIVCVWRNWIRGEMYEINGKEESACTCQGLFAAGTCGGTTLVQSHSHGEAAGSEGGSQHARRVFGPAKPHD